MRCMCHLPPNCIKRHCNARNIPSRIYMQFLLLPLKSVHASPNAPHDIVPIIALSLYSTFSISHWKRIGRVIPKCGDDGNPYSTYRMNDIGDRLLTPVGIGQLLPNAKGTSFSIANASVAVMVMGYGMGCNIRCMPSGIT